MRRAPNNNHTVHRNTPPSEQHGRGAGPLPDDQGTRNGGGRSISDRAYEIYQRRLSTGVHGSPNADWQQAEREINGSQDAVDIAEEPTMIPRAVAERLAVHR